MKTKEQTRFKFQLVYLAFFVIIFTGFAQKNYEPAVESFENQNVLTYYTSKNSQLSLSEAHRRYGKKSLQWEWTGESSMGTSNFRVLEHSESPLAYGDHFPSSPTLQMSLYSETIQDTSIRISFEKDGQEKVWFEIALNFKGWRRIWVPFFEMQGAAPKRRTQVAYDYFKVSSNGSKGKVFFDDITFSQFQDDRHQYPDQIVPFIKKGVTLSDDHWMPLEVNYSRINNLEPRPASMAVRMDLKKFENAIAQELTIPKRYKVYIQTLRDLFNELDLNTEGTTVLGPPLTFKESQEYFNADQQGKQAFNDIKKLGTVMKKLAGFHDRANPAEQEEIRAMFLAGTRYYLDQGWQAGSNGGTRHHVGYNVREITEAFFMMRTFLFQNNLLNEVGSSLHWLFNLGMVLDDPSHFHVNIDYLNTQSYYHMMLVFLFEKQEMQAEVLRAFSKYISITLAQQNELWGFKVDGTTWHHNGHYPAYGVGAFKTVPKIIKTLARTRFRISTAGHANFKNSFLKSRIYSQKYNWGFGNAGRHPIEDGGIEAMQSQFLYMAQAGSPNGTSKIDTEFAAAYTRLWGEKDVFNATLFSKVNGIAPENLSGYYTLPYAATAIHRRNDWAALIKGYSKYVWASEIYVNENRYGRYPANGTIQLLNETGEKGSGFRQEGWDWNRYPGATIIHLPLKDLETKMPLLMFRSQESFAGSTQLGKNGVFGMILNESKGGNADGKEVNIGFPGKLKAKKSVFSFDNKLICIGTNIASIDSEHPTETVLFQSFLEDKKTPVLTATQKIKNFPLEAKIKSDTDGQQWIIDPQGNGYHIRSNSEAKLTRKNQKSYHNKYSVNTGSMNPKGKGVKETEGDYATAWINHGKAPKNASYEYVIYPFLDKASQKNFEEIIQEDSYKVLQADSNAHIVVDKKSSTTGYVIFDVSKTIAAGLLSKVSAPALVMIQQEKEVESLFLSAVQPDLNFPEYKPGRFKNYSQEVVLEITLRGNWVTAVDDSVLAISSKNGKTTLSLKCKDGLPTEVKLIKRSE